MKTRSTLQSFGLFRALVLGAALSTATLDSPAQDARFFRIAGPVATAIIEFRPDGTLVWTNTPTNATFTVQTATSLGGASNWVDYAQIPATNGVHINQVIDFNLTSGLALIPAGSFTMGNTFSGELYNELPLHTVYLSAFYMDRYEVTKALWDKVYNWAITNGYSFDYGAHGKADNHPAHSMTWYDCVKWCNARSEKDGRVPAYYTDAGMTLVYKGGQVGPYVNWGSGYRLPTEAEWEKAARGGLSGQRFPWGNTISHSQANYYSFPNFPYDTSPTEGYHPSFQAGGTPYTSPAGYFAPNGYGLYDMAGNVFEWCWDWFEWYSSATQSDPRGPASGPSRVLRGGCWSDYPSNCRTSLRATINPSLRYDSLGFRCARAAGQ